MSRSTRDATRIRDIEEQLQISEIKSHRSFLLLEKYLGRLAH
jgi:hypothetical protein